MAANTKQIQDGKSEATVSFNDQSKQLTISSTEKPTVTVEKQGNMIVAKDQSGKILSASLKNEQGQVLVLNQKLELTKTYSPQEIQAMKARYSQQQ